MPRRTLADLLNEDLPTSGTIPHPPPLHVAPAAVGSAPPKQRTSAAQRDAAPPEAPRRAARKRAQPLSDSLDRARLIIGAAALWVAGTACTAVIFAQFMPMIIALGGAVLGQMILSNGQLAMALAQSWLARIVGLLLVFLDTTMNFIGGDLLITGINVPINAADPLFWATLCAALLIAILPEIFIGILRGRL